MNRLDAEEENLRAALRWLFANDYPAAARMCESLARFWYVRGLLEEGRHWLEEALALSEKLPDTTRIAVLNGIYGAGINIEISLKFNWRDNKT